MRILVLSWEYPPNVAGGMGKHVEELTPELLAADPDLELHLVTPVYTSTNANGARSSKRLHVYRVPVTRPLHDTYFQGVQAANELLLQQVEAVHAQLGRFDVVHTHDWLTGFAARAYSAAHGVPLVVTVHATERGRLRGHVMHDLQWRIDSAERELVQEADEVITCSLAMAHEVEIFFGVPLDAITVIPNGVRTARFDRIRSLDHSAFRLRYAEPDQEIVFNVGRLVYEKGSDLLVEAAARVLAHRPRVRFVIGGTGPLQERLVHRVRELGLGEQVTLTGFLSDEDRDRLYVVADCCVFPSRYEPFGIVALESMAAGTPVVVANVGGLGAVVTHEKTGITVYPDNVDSLTWGILRTLEDPEAARRRAEQARRAVRRQFAWSHIAQETLAVYAAALAGRSSAVVDPASASV